MRPAPIAFRAALLAALVVAASGGCSFGQPMQDVVIESTESGRTVALKVGQTLLVRLPDLGAAGYSWTVEGNDPALLAPGAPRSEAPPGSVGGGTRILPFTALRAGRVALVFTSRRPWERDRPPARTVTFAVTIAER